MGVWLRKSSHGFHGFAQMAWLRRSSHGIHGIHRSLGVLLAAWVWQDAIPSYICVNPCYLWETLLCKKLLCVPWEYSLPRISQINTDGWLRLFSHGIHRIHRSLGCCWLRGYGRMPYPPNLCASVLSVGATSQPEGSVRIRANLWEVLLSQKVLCFPCYLWEVLLSQKVLCFPCVLWEVLLCQKVLCVPCILWDLSLLVLLVQFLL